MKIVFESLRSANSTEITFNLTHSIPLSLVEMFDSRRRLARVTKVLAYTQYYEVFPLMISLRPVPEDALKLGNRPTSKL